MAIDHLDEKVSLPFDRAAIESGDPSTLADYLYELVKALETRVIKDVHTTVNLMLDLSSGTWFYFGTPDSDGAYADGSWRIGVVDGGVEIQEKVSGTWTTRSRTE